MRLAGHEAGVTALTLQEPLLASGAADNSTKLWDVVSGILSWRMGSYLGSKWPNL